MQELTQIRDAVISALNAGGMAAEAAFLCRRAERAADCENGVETASAVLLSGLPEGIRPGELRWEALAWEKETGMFLRKGSLSCSALFTAQAGEDGEVFLDFILKEVVRN